MIPIKGRGFIDQGSGLISNSARSGKGSGFSVKGLVFRVCRMATITATFMLNLASVPLQPNSPFV